MYDETDMDIGEPLKQKQSQKFFFTSVKAVSIKRPRHVDQSFLQFCSWEEQPQLILNSRFESVGVANLIDQTVKEWTTYGCNNYYDSDQICLEWKKRLGPNMFAIMITMGTKYACNLHSEGDLICLQSKIQKGLFMLAISLNMQQINACNQRKSSRSHSYVILGRFSSLQAYLVSNEREQVKIVRFGFEIASIFGPHWNWDCIYIRSFL